MFHKNAWGFHNVTISALRFSNVDAWEISTLTRSILIAG